MQTTELHLETTESTMEAAKLILDNQDFVLVTSREQTQGKGTRGRIWQGGLGNIYMTLGINRRHLSEARLSLLPLEMGLHLWNEVATHIPPNLRSQLTLKWPNDLMFQGAKTAGILMESQGKFMLIGIGINLAKAPPILDGGNASACLASAGLDSLRNPNLILDLVNGLYGRIKEAQDNESLLVDWQGKVDWNRMQRLRDRPDQPWVKPMLINKQGHLQVEHLEGSREWLVSEYLA